MNHSLASYLLAGGAKEEDDGVLENIGKYSLSPGTP